METALAVAAPVVLFGALLLAAQTLALRACLRRGTTAAEPPAWPPVSVLKPLAGLDDDLFGNLEGICRQDYPAYEVIFCLRSANDPAHAVALKVRERHPGLPITILVSQAGDGLNPKVRNLLPGYRAARHELVLISDSNVHVDPAYLRETVRPLLDPGVGLVTNLIRGRGGRTLGAALENLHLDSFVAGGTAALFAFLGTPCVVGKSMLMRRSALERVGGLGAYRDVLAEDFVIGREIHRSGMRVALSPHPVSNVNRYGGAAKFLRRHARWGRLRRRLGGPRYAAELAANPVFVAACALALAPGGAALALFAGAAAAAVAAAAANRALLRSEAPPAQCLLAPLKDLVVGLLWFVPLASMRVEWRGHRLLVGPDTRLVAPGQPAAQEPPAVPGALNPRTA